MNEQIYQPDAPGPKKWFRLIYKFLLISLVAHIVGLAIFGGVVMIKKMRPANGMRSRSRNCTCYLH